MFGKLDHPAIQLKTMCFTMFAKKMSLSTLAPESSLATTGDWCSNNKMGGVAGESTKGKYQNPTSL
jgi:hypothetical protein